MTIRVRDEAVARAVEALAAATGEAHDEAVRRAVEERLARVAPAGPRGGRLDREKLAELLAFFDSIPKKNEHLTDDEIIGYDENGLFR